ncbi:hypothetical protein FRC00_012284, partial [Tulasnella sp. 408]
MDRNSSDEGWYGPLLLGIVKETGLGCAGLAEEEVGGDRLEEEFEAVVEEGVSMPWKEDRETPATFENAHGVSGDGAGGDRVETRIVGGGLVLQDGLGALQKAMKRERDVRDGCLNDT